MISFLPKTVITPEIVDCLKVGNEALRWIRIKPCELDTNVLIFHGSSLMDVVLYYPQNAKHFLKWG